MKPKFDSGLGSGGTGVGRHAEDVVPKRPEASPPEMPQDVPEAAGMVAADGAEVVMEPVSTPEQ